MSIEPTPATNAPDDSLLMQINKMLVDNDLARIGQTSTMSLSGPYVQGVTVFGAPNDFADPSSFLELIKRLAQPSIEKNLPRPTAACPISFSLDTARVTLIYDELCDETEILTVHQEGEVQPIHSTDGGDTSTALVIPWSTDGIFKRCIILNLYASKEYAEAEYDRFVKQRMPRHKHMTVLK